MTVNLEKIEHEQIHVILVLIALDLIVFVALLSRLQTYAVFSSWCDFL